MRTTKRFVTVMAMVVVAMGMMRLMIATAYGAPWDGVVTNTALWVDADDASTISHTGDDITAWNDKSGNDRHLSTVGGTPTTGTRTINGLNAIDETAAEYLATSADVTFLNGGKYHIIAVAEWDAYHQHSYIAGIVPNQGGRNERVLHGYHGDDSTWMISQFSSDAQHPVSAVAGPVLVVSSALSSGSQVYLNGTLENTHGSQPGPLNALAGSKLAIGYGEGLNGMDGAIGEVIVVKGDLSDEGRQLIEGYLAHKWGLEGSLPGDHPYKSTSPVPPAGMVMVIK